MSEATKITIATGTTAYAADPESDERISAREVRVEVTYRLGPGEDAAQAAARKAIEVEQTRRAVWERIRALPKSDTAEKGYFTPADPGPTPSNGSEQPTVPEAPTPPAAVAWATKPQQLAIQAHFRRQGLSPQDQTALLRERFGKFRTERLTKIEAAELMRCLERDECMHTVATAAR